MFDSNKENIQAVDCNSAMPYYYLAHVANSGQLSDQGETLTHSRSEL